MVKDWLTLPPTIKYQENQEVRFSERPFGTSLAAIVILSAPFALVEVSIFAFLLGLTIYQGFIFSKNLDTDAAPHESRNNFIALVTATGLCSIFFIYVFSSKDLESTIRNFVRPGNLISDAIRGDQYKDGVTANLGLQDVIQNPRSACRGSHDPVHVPEPASFEDPANEESGPKPDDIQPKGSSPDGTQNSQGMQSELGPQMRGLAAALEAAASAHALCAEADLRVASAYRKLREI